jgi:hypothetical protein
VAPESAIHSGPTGGVKPKVEKERARASLLQPAGPGEAPEGVPHGVIGWNAGGENAGGAPANMAAGGRGSPPGAWKGHIAMRPDQGLL